MRRTRDLCDGRQTALFVLAPGSYRLRLGVIDMSNYHIGTLDMPIEIAAASTGPS